MIRRALSIFVQLVLLAAAAGCSSGGRSTSVPAAPQVQTQKVSVTIVTRTAASDARRARYISPIAKSVAINVTPGNPAYLPSSGCANIVANVTSYTIQIDAPVGNDTFLIQSFDGPCVSSPTGSVGSGNVLNSIAPITGTVTGAAANVLNPSGVAPAQPCPAGCAITIAQVANAQTTAMTVSASLGSAIPALTTFEFDPNVTMAMPVTFSIKDNAGNVLTSPDANGATIPLLQPIIVTLSDTSLGAVPQTLGLAMVDANGNVYCPSGPPASSATITFAATATATCAANRTTGGTVFLGTASPTVNFTIANAPKAGDTIVVVYNGATQSVFQSALLTLAFGGGIVTSIPIGGQAQVVTQFGTPAAPAGIAVSNGGSNEFVTAGTKIYAQIAGTALGAGTNALAGTNLSGITYMNSAAPIVYAVDPNCTGCDATHVGIYQTGGTPGTVNGTTPTQLTTAGVLTTAGLIQAVIPPFLRGPVGIAALAPGQGGAGGFGSLFVAANNSVYRLDLASTTTIGAITLIAGTGVFGSVGQGSQDAANGINATFNLGIVPFVGITIDATVSNLLLADPGNNAVRQIGIFGTNKVATFATYASAPGGVAVESVNGSVLTTHPSTNQIMRVASAGANPALFAGINVGNQDGLATQAYPLQFNSGNSVANAGGTGVLPQFAGLYNAAATVPIAVNSNRGQQTTAGLASFVASLRTPQGIALDPASTPNGRFYFVDQGSSLVRTLI